MDASAEYKLALPPRARLTAMEVARDARLDGQVAVVTGASSGLGIETARALAAAGALVVLGVRDPAAGAATASLIRREFDADVEVERLDLTDMASVETFARTVRQRHPEVSIVVANAGVSKTAESHLTNGLDVRFVTNHLGHFLLVNLLYGSLSARGGRVVVVSSAAHRNRPLRLDDLGRRNQPRNDLEAYGQSKRANILFAYEATRRWAHRGVFANAVLPGAIRTGLQRYHDDELLKAVGFIDAAGAPNPAAKTVAEGAATSVWAAVAPELAGRGGLILEDCGLALPTSPQSHRWSGYEPDVIDPAIAAELWTRSLEILAELGVVLPAGAPQ
jgi:NAD(P)-dependent dehydrogenase (short-subunit alcohol dehydrogenase family)